jgi:hypothetical protein
MDTHYKGYLDITMAKTLAIDFDDTIYDWAAVKAKEPSDFDRHKSINNIELGHPLPNAKESLEKFKQLGYFIIIYSCRPFYKSDNENIEYCQVNMMKQWLKDNNVPYDMIWDKLGKPVANLYIDDKGWRFQGWQELDKMLEALDAK